MHHVKLFLADSANNIMSAADKGQRYRIDPGVGPKIEIADILAG